MFRKPIEIKDAIYAANREQWRAWLDAHYADKTEAWLLLYKKGASTPSVTYSEAVEEALCFGWIDSMIKGVDTEKYTQRFTPRRKGSDWTPANTALGERLIQEGRMKPAGLEAFQSRKDKRVASVPENREKGLSLGN